MESNLNNIKSEYFNKDTFQKQLQIIKQASELAQSKIDYYTAHDDNILRAIEVIQEFLRKKHRLCYGGQAINAHLPAKYKFYDPEYNIPDYDFFTPSQETDVITIIKDLQHSGFTEISVREGMHEGTLKIYVDYTPVADITEIDSKLYKVLSKKEFRLDGISYLDANTLRMLMYLELSRPRGEVERWPKIYERLMLFNEFVPKKMCIIKKQDEDLTKEQVQFSINLIINNKRIFAGADLVHFYSNALKIKQKKISWIFNSKKPIIFFSQDPQSDAIILQSEFNSILKTKKTTIKSYESKGSDLIPSLKVISQGKKALVFIIHQTACHSYFNIPIEDDRVMRIASMDTLITLYFSLGLIDSNYFDMGSMECLANQLVQISINSRTNPTKFSFPFISIICSGRQPTLPSLIRAKVKRITSKRQQIKNILNKVSNKTLRKIK